MVFCKLGKNYGESGSEFCKVCKTLSQNGANFLILILRCDTFIRYHFASREFYKVYKVLKIYLEMRIKPVIFRSRVMFETDFFLVGHPHGVK